MSAVAELLSTIERNASRPFLIEAANGRELTHGEAYERALALLAALRAGGVRHGERLAVGLANTTELAIVYEAALLAGLVVVPVGSGFGRRQLRELLSCARPRLVLVGREQEALRRVAGELGLPVRSVTAAGGEGELDLWSLPRAGEDAAGLLGADDEDIVSVHFTSGSTGTPRGVAHRLRDFIDNALRYARAAGLDDGHRFHNCLPMTYMAGYYNLLLLPLRIGASVVIDRAFDARSALGYWEAPHRHDASVLWLVPTIIAMLLTVDRGELGRAYCRERVRHVACGTAPLDRALRERFEDVYGVAVHDSYGLSETLLVSASTPRRPARPDSVGLPLRGVEARVAAESGAPGPIMVRSPDMMAGYLEGCDARGGLRLDRSIVRDGWLDTGDIGAIDADGELRITGRQKDVIIRGGVNISAAELERTLAGARGVEHLAAVGVPHELLGEQVVVVFATTHGASVAEAEAALAGRAADDDVLRPDMYVHIDEMPLTPTGKIRKGALRNMVSDLLDLPGTAAAQAANGLDALARLRRPVDLTHPIRHAMLSFPSPNHPSPEVTVLARHETAGRMTHRLVMGTHTGTHVDAPLHFVPGGEAVERIALARLVGPADVVDLSGFGALAEVSREALERALGGPPRHPRLLLRFDWSPRFGDPRYYSRSPYLSMEACRWLLDAGVDVLGMDTPSPDDPRHGAASGNDSPNHHLLLGAGAVLLEYLTNLDRLGSEVLLIALPLPVEGADGAPARVIAFT
ncbi:MAG TPA: AMP-binding protein [Solirubrobacteraceae bacterium]|jgi:arylformamidase|nr:AMP-binding protein [Solirubrobacteraceae bacterium]